MDEALGFDHIHLISRDPKAAADWYVGMFGGKVTAVQENLRGAPQLDVRVGGMTIVIRGQRPGEQPASTRPMHAFDGYSSHDEWGTDHFGFTYRGDLRAFCDELKRKGVRMAVEPWEFKPGMVLCYVAAPDGVSIELIQVGS
ncbi:MAG: VOC family protein [Betaproteobacteria bacterium]|jgi:catechol 2,3-dioxygenase-like lactoylglutathione lyase family enzyme